MAEVVWLDPGKAPPEHEDWALVARDSSGQYAGRGSKGLPDEATFYVPYPALEADQDVAIAKAKAWADKHGVPTVYVVVR